MNQSFYVGAVGMSQQLKHLNIEGSNIANVNTYGFKAEKARFQQLIYQNLQGIEEELPYGVGTRVVMTSTDHIQGSVADTGRAQDYMIDGNGFFALIDLATNEITFTRSGAFQLAQLEVESGEVDENGDAVMERRFYLSDGQGRFVLSNRGELIEVNEENRNDMQPVGIFDFRNYDGMLHLDDVRFASVEKNGNVMIGDGKLVQRKLEGSNVDLADSFTKVIEAQRAYGLALRMVQTSDEIESTINNLSN